ncbi:outer membrane beta-barrel protein [Hugenholtzia roseola]|uniref:outer membrane beta-barrel protein n=1 Tax=Hugenholtzia roseola TaxID=1002 RepID=UPI00041C9A48|nr:outer membrane beta-barrel protein [Hugenholtzia roseola]
MKKIAFAFLLFFSMLPAIQAQNWSIGAELGIIRSYASAESQGDVLKTPGRNSGQFGLRATYHFANDMFGRIGFIKAHYNYVQGFEVGADKYYRDAFNPLRFGGSSRLYAPIFVPLEVGKRFWLKENIFALSPYAGATFQYNRYQGIPYSGQNPRTVNGESFLETHQASIISKTNIALQAGVGLEAYFWQRFCFSLNYEYMKGLVQQSEGFGNYSINGEVLGSGTTKSYGDKMALIFSLRYDLTKPKK